MTARRAAAIAVAALAVASAAITFPSTWSWTNDQHDSFSGLASADNVFKYQELLPAQAVAFTRARLRPRERYFVLTHAGSLFAGVNYPTAVRTFARYALLPAVQVQSPSAADVVVGVRADPRTLGLGFAKVERDPSGSVIVARVAR